MGRVPDPPWTLRGECILAWARPAGAGPRLPAGVRPLPGPWSVVGVRYDDSPFGPFTELSVARPACLGLRPGVCVVGQAVTSAEARRAYRAAWGLPTELGALRWEAGADDRSVAWEERGVVLRARPRGPLLPMLPVPARSIQWGPAGAVIAPRRLRARLRAAACELHLEAGDPWEALAGRHPGAVLSGLAVLAAAARHPAGLVSSIPRAGRARPAAGPAGGAATMAGPGAYGSVG